MGQVKSAYPLDKIMLYGTSNEFGIISETFGTNCLNRKQRELLIHDPAL
jgi:hypothetical protein